ncbi:MAG: hypothetical protein ACFN4V_07675, partial [Prevotella denticola]
RREQKYQASGTGVPAAGETTSQLWTGNCLCLFSLSGGQDILHKSEKAQRADNVHDKQKSNVEFSGYFLKKRMYHWLIHPLSYWLLLRRF